MSETECREVLDILQMFRVLTFSLRKVDDKKGIDEHDLTFDGFDGNEESSQHGYAKWFCKSDRGRFTELTERGGFDFNSHSPRLSRYRAMLAAWTVQGQPTDLTREQLLEIAAVA
jgi:uncharacterized protein YfbU (UPF0304 family)